jgi:hypothetical protein
MQTNRELPGRVDPEIANRTGVPAEAFRHNYERERYVGELLIASIFQEHSDYSSDRCKGRADCRLSESQLVRITLAKSKWYAFLCGNILR